jgi:hypothetical protein
MMAFLPREDAPYTVFPMKPTQMKGLSTPRPLTRTRVPYHMRPTQQMSLTTHGALRYRLILAMRYQLRSVALAPHPKLTRSSNVARLRPPPVGASQPFSGPAAVTLSTQQTPRTAVIQTRRLGSMTRLVEVHHHVDQPALQAVSWHRRRHSPA